MELTLQALEAWDNNESWELHALEGVFTNYIQHLESTKGALK